MKAFKRVVFIGVMLATLISSFLLGVYSTKIGFTSDVLKPMFHENINIPVNWYEGKLANVKTIRISLGDNEFKKLEKKRDQALEIGNLVSQKGDYVPALISYNDSSYNVKLRLKGDVLTHLNGKRWSMRIKVLNGKHLFGLKKFSIQHPKARNYIYEWIYHMAIKREGGIGLKYDFIKVIINNEDMGIYALEEHFDKRTVESNGRSMGAIIRFNEELMWEQNSFPVGYNWGTETVTSEYIDVYDKKNTDLEELNKAIVLLDGFRSGKLSVSEVFDVHLLSKFFAITELMDGIHALDFNNTRYYYNPSSGFLEPIAFDKGQGYFISTIEYLDDRTDYGHREYTRNLFFSDTVFLEAYFSQLNRVSKPEYVSGLFNSINDELNKKLAIIHSSYPYFHYTEDYIHANAEYIQNLLSPAKGIYVYEDKLSKDSISLYIGCIQSLPIEIQGIKTSDDSWIYPVKKVIIAPKRKGKSVKYREYKFFTKQVPESLNRKTMQVGYKILGTDSVRFAEIISKDLYPG